MHVPDTIRGLAAENLKNYRTSRYDGTGFDLDLGRLEPADRDILARIYEAVQTLALLWPQGAVRLDHRAAEEYIRGVADDRLMTDARRLGAATRAAGREDGAVRKAIHDVRGGGLSVFLGTADLLDLLPGNEILVRKCFEAARDHAKIMRNIFPDIDPPNREVDTATRPHAIDHFVTKWDGMEVKQGEGAVTVAVRCAYRGSISARCLETSSIDRVVYNYVNNAVRFSADGRVTLWIVPVGAGLTRWVVENRITPDQAAFLAAAAGSGLNRLYAGGITRGGSGVGLTNCADIIADCFGLESPADAVSHGYLGATSDGSSYYAWFHWPAFTPEG